MSRHLALVADNSLSAAPLPGYAESIAHGRCQRCLKAAPVRTVGMKSPESVRWAWLALCEPCIETGVADGYPMVAAVRPDPLAELREALALPPDPPPPPEKLLAAPRLPVTVARFPSKCPACGDAIAEGDPIALVSSGSKRWHHARCAS